MASQMKFKVHHVLDDPREDEYGTYWLLCRVEDANDESMFDDEIPFMSLEAAYKFKSHFLSSIDPIVIEFETENRYDS